MLVEQRLNKEQQDFWMIIRKGPNLMDEKRYALDLLNRKGIRIGPGTIVYDMDLKEDHKYIAKILIKVLKEKRILLDTGTIHFESFLDDSDCEGILLIAKIKGKVDKGIIEDFYEVKKTYRKASELPSSNQVVTTPQNIHGFNVPNKQHSINNRINLLNTENKTQRPPNLDKITYPNKGSQTSIYDRTKDPYMETMVDNSRPEFKEKLAKAKEDANWEKLSEKKEGCFVATAVYGSYGCEEVLYLRRIRDEVLYQSKGGRLFIQFYYSWSPFVARVISDKNFIMKPIKKFLDNLIIFLKKYY